MMQAPGDYPFCLSNQQWAEHCQALWGGSMDTTDYTPPKVYQDTVLFIFKTLFAIGVGVFAGAALPEEMMAATAVATVGGPAAARVLLIAGSNLAVDHLLPTGNPWDDSAKAGVWKRYQLENRRRRLG